MVQQLVVVVGVFGVSKSNNLSTWLRHLLLLAWACLLAAGLWGGSFLPSGLQIFAGTWGRMGSSISLVMLAILGLSQTNVAQRKYASLILGGMTLGTIGDFFNADLLSAITRHGTIAAIIAFGLGHVLYIAAILEHLKRYSTNRWFTSLAIAGWQLIGLASWYIIVFHGDKAREIVWPALGYCLLLAGTAGISFAWALHRPRMWPLALGASFFLLSDLLLAIGMFQGSYPFRSEAVWLTYGPGQMLIVYSIWLLNPSTFVEEHSHSSTQQSQEN